MEKKWNIITSNKIIIPGKEKTKDDLLENLNSISSEEIEHIGTDIECQNVIKKFYNYSWDITMKDIDLLIDNWYLKIIWERIRGLRKDIHKEVAIKIIKKATAEWRDRIWDYLENFEELDNDVALALIRWWYWRSLDNHIDEFNGLKKDVAVALYEHNHNMLPLEYFDENEANDIVIYYIEQWEYEFNFNYAKCDLEFAERILKTNNENKFKIICENASDFPKEIHNDIALAIINTWWTSSLLKWISWFSELNKEVAFAIAKNHPFTCDLKNFVTEERKEIVLHILDEKYSTKPSLSGVPRLNIDFANQLIERKEYAYLVDNIEYFFERDHNNIAHTLLDNWYLLTHGALRKFTWKDKWLVVALFEKAKEIDSKNIDGVDQEKFKNIDAKYIWEYVAKNPSQFTGLDDEIANELIDLWFWDLVKKHKKLYKDLSTLTKMRLLIQ